MILLTLYILLNSFLINAPIFKNAVSITTDGKGFIYVLDKDRNEISKLDSNMNLIKRLGDFGWNQGQFNNPTYIDGSSGLDILVSDPSNYRIQRLDLNLAFITELKTTTETFLPEFKFNNPVSTLVVNSNDIYVIDYDNRRVVIFPKGTNPNNSFGDYKTSKIPLLEPVKLLKDNNNFIYIYDKGYKGILKFDSFGNFVQKLSLNNIKTFSIYNGQLYILTTDNKITIFDPPSNSYKEEMNLPPGYDSSKITDILIYNSEKYFILEKNKLSFFKP